MSRADRTEHLTALYQAFNGRDISRVLDAMTEDVDWSNGWEGGRLEGHDAIRDYWERQWAQVRVTVTPTAVLERPDGTVQARVRQVVRDSSGTVLDRRDVCHDYSFEGDLVRRMEVEPS